MKAKKDKKCKEDREDEGDGKREKTKRKKEKPEQDQFAFSFEKDLVNSEMKTSAAESQTNDKESKKHEADKTLLSESHPPTANKTALANLESTDEATNSGSESLASREEKRKKKKKEDDVTTRHKGVLERAAKALKEAQKHKADPTKEAEEDDGAEPIEVHGLEPLPQPEPVAQDGSRPTYETLPAWIANPTRVTQETKASFVDLGINKETAARLCSKGYENAFAVQTAVIPLLLPIPDRQGDVVVSAATGSGKTLAYVLPMVRDISQGLITRLRGVIVVPTRELVLQAKEVCETCAGAFSGPNKKTVKIGISMGNKQFEHEQGDLVEEDQRYDPAGHQKWLKEHFTRDSNVNIFDDAPKPLPDHVIDYASKVDILICTPGRLVDHINRTHGFTLDYVRWLVVDEADKLLGQTFQDWLPVVMPRLSNLAKAGARDFPDSNKSGVRKVVLSATMTRDLSLLNGLKLSRPKMIILESSKDGERTQEVRTEHVLPERLQESAIKTRDPSLKPLYLVDLLNSSHMSPLDGADEDVEMDDADEEDASSTESDSESDSSNSDNESVGPNTDSTSPLSTQKDRQNPSMNSFRTTVLIFTKSNETAVRLSRLLSLLSPSLAPLVGTLTSTTRSSQRRKTLHAFASRKLRILVASDLVARGIDLANLDHVVNYDMPTSVASYVHRVGRTARAGRSGKAWTLFTKTEAGWFWTAVAGKGESKSRGAAEAGHIKRKDKIGEIRIDDRWEEGKLAEFESALEKLGREASERRKR